MPSLSLSIFDKLERCGDTSPAPLFVYYNSRFAQGGPLPITSFSFGLCVGLHTLDKPLCSMPTLPIRVFPSDDNFYPRRRNSFWIIFLLSRRKSCTTGPVSNAATTVPMPTVPPRKKRQLQKTHHSRFAPQRNAIRLCWLILSLKIIAIRSLGPVPELLLMTTDMPNPRIIQSTSIKMTHSAGADDALIKPPNTHKKVDDPAAAKCANNRVGLNIAFDGKQHHCHQQNQHRHMATVPCGG